LHHDEIHLTDYLKVLAHRRWAAITAFLVVMVAAVIYTFTATPIYRARVQLLIENENPNVVSFKEVIDQEKTTNDYYQTQYKVLQSRSLARRTIDRLDVWNVFMPKTQPAPNKTVAQEAAIDAFLSHLTVSPVRNSRLVDLEYESPDAELAA